MEAQRGEEALPGSLSTGRAPALGLNAISAVASSGLTDLIAQLAANWTDRKSRLSCSPSSLLWSLHHVIIQYHAPAAHLHDHVPRKEPNVLLICCSATDLRSSCVQSKQRQPVVMCNA